MLKHLHSAARRLAAVRISDDQRRQLALLVHDAIDRVEARLRQRLRPKIAAALDEVGLMPQNLPERVARKKLVEELLDQIAERGFLSMGDLRDAISRNNLKLPDISRRSRLSPRRPVASRRPQAGVGARRRVSARRDSICAGCSGSARLGFGTRMGRFLTRFAVVPFGGAFVALAFVHELWELITGVRRRRKPEFHSDLAGASMLFVGAVPDVPGQFRGVSPGGRRPVLQDLVSQVLRAVVIEPIRWIVQSPLLQRILHSRSVHARVSLPRQAVDMDRRSSWCVTAGKLWNEQSRFGGRRDRSFCASICC